MYIKVTDQQLDPEEARAAVADPASGGVVLFLGTIRNEGKGGRVTGLKYETHAALLGAEAERIAEEVYRRWTIKKVALLQRVGKLGVGEVGIVLAVSSPHRREALKACEYMIEQVKKRAPIWKKEFYSDHESWVNCE